MTELEYFHGLASEALNELKSVFSEPVRMTLIVRKPGDWDSEACITEDQLDDVIAVLERMKDRKRMGLF